MEWIPVESSQIAAVGYAEDAEYPLGVKFLPTKKQQAEQLPGSIYEYANVAETMYYDLIHSLSVGKFFESNIKAHPDLYPYRRAV